MKPALLVVLPLTLLAGVQTPARSIPTGNGVIAGKVVDALTRQPIAGVDLTLSLSNQFAPESRQKQTTAGDGAFRFANLGAAQFGLSADRRSYQSSWYGVRRPAGTSAVIELGRDEGVDDVVVLMWPITEIRGTVVDDHGEPVSSVFVRGLGTGSQPDPDRATGNVSAYTDIDGKYRMRVTRPGFYVVCVEPRYQSLPILPESDPPRGLQVTAERPPSGARVPMAQLVQRVPYLIDPDGHWLLEISPGLTPPPPGPDGRLSALTSTCAPAATTMKDSRVVEVKAGVSIEHVDIALQLRPAARISGRLLGRTGPIADALINLAGLDDAIMPIASALTDPQGAFTFVVAPVGTRKITGQVMNPPIKATAMASGMPSVYHPDYGMGDIGGFWFAAPLVVGDRPMSDVVLAALPGTTVTGRLESDRSGPGAAPGVQGAMVSLRMPGTYAGPSASAGSGSFTIPDVRPGSYVLEPNAQGWAVASITRNGVDVLGVPIDVGSSGISGIEIVMTTKSSDLSGIARDAQGRVVRDATIVIFPVNPAARVASRDFWSVGGLRMVRATSGHYSFTSLPPGGYFVAALDDAVMGPWPDRAFIASLETHAMRVSIGLGEHKTLDLVMSSSEKR
jgi:hypothetical protein